MDGHDCKLTISLEARLHNDRADLRSKVRAERCWSKLKFLLGVPSGQWIALRYRTSTLDQLTRPLIRFWNGCVPQIVPMPGALFGIGEWIGRIPDGTDSVELSCFESGRNLEIAVEDCTRLTRLELVKRALRHSPARTVVAGIQGILEQSVDMALASSAMNWPFTRYDEWRTSRTRDLDLGGIDRPRHDWCRGIHVRYVCRATGESASRLSDTFTCLRQQVYPHWSLALVAHEIPRWLRGDSRVVLLSEHDAGSEGLFEGINRPTVLAPIVAGSRMPDFATAAIAEHMAVFPECALAYADEDEITLDGKYLNPELKPDWSREFQRSSSYVGDAVYVGESVIRASRFTPCQVADPVAVRSLFCGHTGDIGHIRRVLLTRPSVRTKARRDAQAVAPPLTVGSRSNVTIVIPTKDRADLLQACTLGITSAKDIDFEVILVDNGSTEPRTLELYRRLSEDPRFRIKYAPGPFNFAQLCNDGASEAHFSTLLFLNNDIEPIDDFWLADLLHWVKQPSIGAVGAKLLYPSGRLQHGGMVLGLKGNVGHLGIGTDGDSAGYLQSLKVPHEVAAVTGACLAVERSKFEAVGGFDAECFPVELNDVDLCLRLHAKGWRTLMVPACRLTHHESATRGRSRNAQDRYPNEHEAFRQRWAELTYDDPFFHPALALTSTHLSLG
jgi:GT2 family glycosyltransferase